MNRKNHPGLPPAAALLSHETAAGFRTARQRFISFSHRIPRVFSAVLAGKRGQL
jgi:hypothetical protein